MNYPGKENQTYYVEGFMRSGKISSAFLKADVLIYEGDEEDGEGTSESESEESENDEANVNDIQLKM